QGHEYNYQLPSTDIGQEQWDIKQKVHIKDINEGHPTRNEVVKLGIICEIMSNFAESIKTETPNY
ncbi:MAG: hypothetical protein K2M54_12080, partial [Muribaculaceae bacterium]|nr:hypothetical protein [Muribaculaceae bacterium]